MYLEGYAFWNNNVNFSCQSTFEFFLVLLPYTVKKWQVRILWGSVATREPKRILASFNSSMAHVLIIFSIYSCFIWDPFQYLWRIYHNFRRSCCRTWLTQRMMSHLLRLRLIYAGFRVFSLCCESVMESWITSFLYLTSFYVLAGGWVSPRSRPGSLLVSLFYNLAI